MEDLSMAILLAVIGILVWALAEVKDFQDCCTK